MRQVTVYSVLEAGVRRQVTGYRVQGAGTGGRQASEGRQLEAGGGEYAAGGGTLTFFAAKCCNIEKKQYLCGPK